MCDISTNTRDLPRRILPTMYYTPPPISPELRELLDRIDNMPEEPPESPYDLSDRTHAIMDSIMLIAADIKEARRKEAEQRQQPQ